MKDTFETHVGNHIPEKVGLRLLPVKGSAKLIDSIVGNHIPEKVGLRHYQQAFLRILLLRRKPYSRKSRIETAKKGLYRIKCCVGSETIFRKKQEGETFIVNGKSNTPDQSETIFRKKQEGEG